MPAQSVRQVTVQLQVVTQLSGAVITVPPPKTRASAGEFSKRSVSRLRLILLRVFFTLTLLSHGWLGTSV